MLSGSGIRAIRTPPRSPQANAFAFAFAFAFPFAFAFAELRVQSLRHELLDRTITWNEKQLRTLLVEYIDHYNTRRPLRGIKQRSPNDTGDVVQVRPTDRTTHSVQRAHQRVPNGSLNHPTWPTRTSFNASRFTRAPPTRQRTRLRKPTDEFPASTGPCSPNRLTAIAPVPTRQLSKLV